MSLESDAKKMAAEVEAKVLDILTPAELEEMELGLLGRSDGLRGEQQFVDDSDWTTERARKLLTEVKMYREHGFLSLKKPGTAEEAKGSFGALGNKVTEYSGLEVFDSPNEMLSVLLESDEVTAVCPVTGQPDWYRVEVEYRPGLKCIESKTFKLYLHSFRNRGLFCEALAQEVMMEVRKYAQPAYVLVRVSQKPRGGVTIRALAEWPHEPGTIEQAMRQRKSEKSRPEPSPTKKEYEG